MRHISQYNLKYRIYPSQKQQKILTNIFGCCRWIWNHYLDVNEDLYHKGFKHWNNFDCNYDLKNIKKLNPWLSKGSFVAYQQKTNDLEQAYQRFWKHLGLFPKHKTRKSKQSFRLPNNNSGKDIVIKNDNHNSMIKIPKLGWVKIKQDRPVGKDTIIKSITVSKTKSGQYYTCLLVEKEYSSFKHGTKKIGIDLGIKWFISDSNDNQVANPKFIDRLIERKRRLQQKLSRSFEIHKIKINGKTEFKRTNNQEKVRKLIAKLDQRIADSRNDFQWKLARKLASENKAICLETLQMKNMIKNRKLAKWIADASWGSFKNKLIWQCKKSGCKLYGVDTFYASSQICSHCGHLNKQMKDLSERSMVCEECGEVLDRDINAAKNILKEGLKTKISLINKEPKITLKKIRNKKK